MPARVSAVLDQVKKLERELAALKGKLASAQGDDMVAQAVEVKGARVLAAKLELFAESLFGTRSFLVGIGDLQRVYRAVSSLERVPEGSSRLGRAFHLSLAYPLCLGCPRHGV